jgi:sodium-coupled neutral amino acid transporter 11
MDKIAPYSFGGLLCVIIIVILVAVHGPQSAKAAQHSIGLTGVKGSFLAGVGVIVFSYLCQHSAFIMYSNMRNQSTSSWNAASAVAITASGIISAAIAIAGYISFGNEVLTISFDSLTSLVSTKYFE